MVDFKLFADCFLPLGSQQVAKNNTTPRLLRPYGHEKAPLTYHRLTGLQLMIYLANIMLIFQKSVAA